jgi:hypothetical protein
MQGHRHLIAYIAAGGLIQPDDSGIAWVCATRSGNHFPNETVARVRERGFACQGEGYQLVESQGHPGKFGAEPGPMPKRKKRPRQGEPKPRPRRGATNRDAQLPKRS